MPRPRSFFFDITTTSVWRGHSVGIIRVEQELARRVRKFLGSDANFCFYDKPARTFRIVRAEYAARILADTARLPMVRPLMLGGGPLDTGIPGIQSDVAAQLGTTAVETVTADAALGTAIGLDPSVTIISGGSRIDQDIERIGKLRAETGFNYISVVHDLTPVNLPHYNRPGAQTVGLFAALVRIANGYICNSAATLRDLIAYCEQNGLLTPPASTFGLGSNFLASAAVGAELPGDLTGKNIVLMVSTLQPRKNHRTAYEAWYHGILAGTIDPGTDRLVFVGARSWRLDDLLNEIALNPVTRESIVVLRDVSDAALQLLYRAAALVIVPSFHEGYGLPLAEAFGYGKVCVTSGAGALSEIGTGFRIDIDPRDTIRWSATISELLRDPAKRSRIEASIRQNYRPTTWDMSAEIFFTAVRDIALRSHP